MLKSWKTRALAVGAAVTLGPLALAPVGLAQPAAPTVVSLTPQNGPPGQVVAVTGTGCGTAQSPATSVELFVTGPAVTTPTPTAGTLVPGSTSGDFTGSVTIPQGARAGETYSVLARCTSAAGTGPTSTGGPTFSVIDPTGITGIVTTATGGVTGTGLTSTSGATTATTGTTTGATTTTGVATPIPQQPNFTG